MPSHDYFISLLGEGSRPLTREIFGNVPRAAQLVFYGLALFAIALWLYGVMRRVRLWLKGTHKGVGSARKLQFAELCAMCCCSNVYGVAARQALLMCCCLAASSCSRSARYSFASST